jgi:sugar O-acyltransferase (sialic acid O-acetyltransferase NeuD family)
VQDAHSPLLTDLHHHSPLPSGTVAYRPGERVGPATHQFAPPADCQRILIVGAGGFGREVLQWARDAWPDHAGRIAGFLSSDEHVLDGFDGCPEIIGHPDAYRPSQGDYLLLAIGVPYVRRQVAESLLDRGAEFLTLVHPTAIVAASARIGTGAILCPYSIASDTCRVGRFVIMNYHASLGHDASAGDFSVLSPYATLGGNAHIEDDVFLGLHASIGPGRTVGARSKVSSNSCVLTNAAPASLVFGVPGQITALLFVPER